MTLWNSTLKPGKPLQRKVPMRPRKAARAQKTGACLNFLRPTGKRAAARSPYLAACRGQQCYLQIPGICLGPAGVETVVPCHSNQLIHGKGMGLKAGHQFTVPGCMSCHRWLDQSGAPRQEKFQAWDRAYARWVADREAV